MVLQHNQTPITIYYQMTTTNQSFMDMHYFLKHKGIKHNRFFLALYDPDLAGVDPRDPNLNSMMKRKILRECIVNFWYFIREVVRVPDQGGDVGSGKRYKLHRGNLAQNFCFLLNWNIFLELPRQYGKTISAVIWYLWVFNFGTTNSEIMFMNKKHDDSKMNLQRLKDIRNALPSYLKMDAGYGPDGQKKKPRSNVETLEHISNGNKITTKPGAKSKALANTLGRGCTMPLQWYDEYAFIVFNSIIYASATPAYKTASSNAALNGAPYGILITTTPGDMTTDEGMAAYNMKNNATPFNEQYYDFNMNQLIELKNTNTSSSFIYIRFTYQQLGGGAEYFREMTILLEKDWDAIRREILLEWAKGSSNSPFKQQDLDEIGRLVMKEPIQQICVANYYFLNIYKRMELYKYPPIMGVDVSGGYQKDSSAITIIDSKTTDVAAEFNCNYISPNDLAKVIYEIVIKYMPNAIVNVERNGGFGASTLSILIKTKIKRNLYFEIKDRVIEERFDGYKSVKKTKKVKVYGFDETKASRDLLMEIMRDRVDNHKAKIISPLIYDELTTLEVKKNGKIEHSSNAHDDQVFSWLLALYVWYEGKNLMENFGLEKATIKTDEDYDMEFGIDEEYTNIVEGMNNDTTNNMIQDQLEYLSTDRTMSFQQWEELERQKDKKAMDELLNTRLGRLAYSEKFNVDLEDIPGTSSMTELPNDLFDSFYTDNNVVPVNTLLSQFNKIQNYR